MASIPIIVSGQGQTSLPSPTAEQAKALARIILCDEARRSGSPTRGSHPKFPISGHFVYYSGKSSSRRGSDRVERIYASVELLKRSGLTDKEATSEVAEMLGTKIGNSKRGRPSRASVPRDLVRSAQIVRSSYNSFKKRHPWKERLSKYDPVVEKWFATAVQLARWSEDFSEINESFFKEPNLQAIHAIARTISVCAKHLRDLYVEYPIGDNRTEKAPVPAVLSHSVKVLPNG